MTTIYVRLYDKVYRTGLRGLQALAGTRTPLAKFYITIALKCGWIQLMQR